LKQNNQSFLARCRPLRLIVTPQISHILQQPAGMAVPKCINLQPQRAFEPIFTASI